LIIDTYIHPETVKNFIQQYQTIKNMEYGTAEFVKALFFLQETLSIEEETKGGEHSDLYYLLEILFGYDILYHIMKDDLDAVKRGKALFSAFLVFAQRYGL
jgi:hypothetical protein